MSFRAYCPHCQAKVTAGTVLGRAELIAALDSRGEVNVMHVSNGGDHSWSLIKDEKENLRKAIVTGLIK